MAEVTSPSVARDAAVLLRVRELRPDHLPRVHRVAASALTQKAPKMDGRRLLAAYQKLTGMLTTDKQRAELKKMGTILFSSKY